MKLPRKFAAAGFAHLLGLSAASTVSRVAAGKAADEELDEKDEKDASRAEDDEKKSDEGDPGAEEGDDESDKEKKSKKAKSKAKGNADDDGSDNDEPDAEEDERDESDKEKAARKAERARCKAIFSCAAAGTRPDMAAHLAFNTSMSATGAVAMLDAIAAGNAPTGALGQRMASLNLPNPGADSKKPQQAQGSSAAQMIINAGKQRRGES